MHIKQLSGVLFLKIIVFALLFSTSCSKYQKLLKSNDLNLKYEMAKEYYNKNDYFRALPLFEELINVYKATDKGEKIYYYYAYCHYGLGDYVLAAYHFKNFVNSFQNSELAEECQYMFAHCLYNESPIASLDQSSTYKAIDAFQLFINLYPNSNKSTECNMLIDKLRRKLEIKAFENANLYYRIGNYKAAIISLNNILNDYPSIGNRDEISFLIIKSSYLLAVNSVEDKKEERLQSTINSYHKFVDSHSESKYIKEAETIYENTVKIINHKTLNL